MKKIGIILIIILGLGSLFAQTYADDLFFSEYVEGASNNKAIEIFNGTGAPIDLSQYTVKLASNGGTWSTTNIITPTGTLAHNDVFVIANSQASAAILAVSDVTSTVTYFNGDDALGLFHGTTLIDVFGIYQNDPGTAWPVAGVADATLNHTLIRKPTVIAGVTDWAIAAGTNADDSQWIVQAQDYITDLGMHTFTPGGGGDNTATPTFNPPAGIYTQAINVSLSCSTANAVIYYTTNGSTPTTASTVYTNPIPVNANTTIKAIAQAPGLGLSFVATAAYTFPVSVSNLTALRASPADGTTIYYVTGEIFLSFKQTFRNQKFFQDGGAGILVDDMGGIVTTQLNVGDGVEGLLGKISEYGGMLQFVPTANITNVTSTDNPIDAVTVTFTDLIDNFENYESRLVKIMGVSFPNASGNFANGTTYPVEDNNDSYNLRTSFYDVDYIGTPIPTIPMDISGIPNSRTDGAYFTPRNLADIALPSGGVAAPTFNPPGGQYMAPQTVSISCATAGASIYYTTNGAEPTSSSTLYTTPINISTTTTLKAKAYLGADASVVNTAVYSFPLSVASVTALRAMPVGSTVYMLSSPVQLAYQQTYRNQKFVQDNSSVLGAGGILIDDMNGVITNTYSIGDMIPGLVGTLSQYGNMLQFVPTANAGTAVSNQPLSYVSLSLQDLNNPDVFEQVESRLVALRGVQFSTPEGNFATGQVYPIEDQIATFNFRTSFYDADYIGTALPQGVGIFRGIPNSRTDGNYFSATQLSDFIIYQPVSNLNATNVVNGIRVNWNWTGGTPSYVTGFKLYRNDVEIASLGATALEYIDTNVSPGSVYTYLLGINCEGNYELNGGSVQITAVSNDDPQAPELVTSLVGNYPNPFNPSTTIAYSLKESSDVRIDIYNTRGQLVRTLGVSASERGSHTITWNGLDQSGRELPSGVYYYKMSAGKYSSTRKMIMMK